MMGINQLKEILHRKICQLDQDLHAGGAQVSIGTIQLICR